MSSFIDQLNPQKTALLLIEFQNEFAAEGGKLHEAVAPVMAANNMLANAIKTTQMAREKGIKVFHLAITFSPDFREISSTPFGILQNVKNGQCFVKDTWNADYVEGMKPATNDVVVLGKSGLCGFESTNLQFLLGQHSIETVAIAGFNVITLTDCTAATSLEGQEAAVKFTFPMFSLPMTHEEFLQKLK